MNAIKKILNAIKYFFKLVINCVNSNENDWTKETTYALIVGVDYRRDTYPKYAVQYMTEYLSKNAGTVKVLLDAEATSDAFLAALREGLKYKTFFFYEFAHGCRNCIRLADRNVLASEVWDVLKAAHNRIVGFFDSCYSGSMIDDGKEIFAAANAGNSIAKSIVNMMKQQDNILKASANENAKPRLRLYSAAADGVITTYEPENGSEYTNAIRRAVKEMEKNPEIPYTYEEFDKRVLKFGTYGPKNNPEYRVVPQFASYGEDFSNYELFK